MKVTVDEERAASTFVYAQLCAEETAQRFVAQAMTAGVPHVNLRLLREFLILLPPRDRQEEFAHTVTPLLDLAFALEREAVQVEVVRDRLMPKLVTGELEVDALDLDVLVEGAVA